MSFLSPNKDSHINHKGPNCSYKLRCQYR